MRRVPRRVSRRRRASSRRTVPPRGVTLLVTEGGGQLEILPFPGGVLRVSGPVTADDAQRLISELEANDTETVVLHGYASGDTQALVDLFLGVRPWLDQKDRRLGISTANSPELDIADLAARVGPQFMFIEIRYDGTK